MADIVQQILSKPIHIADQIIKGADDVSSFKTECLDLKSKTEKLAALIRQAARASNDLYERPTRRIIDDTEQVLDKTLALIIKCRANSVIKRLFTIIPAAAFRKSSQQLENSIGDVSWLLRVSAKADNRDDEYLGLPPIAANEPILCLIWEQIAILYTGSLEDRSDAAATLASLARDNTRYGNLIIEEGGVIPLLKLAKEGKLEGQENAARAIGLLGWDPESVEHLVNAGVCSVFSKVLKEGSMKVQGVVAWAVSQLASKYPKCQDPFAQNNIIRLLVSHLAFETVQEHSKYTIVSKQKMSIHSVLMASSSQSDHNNGDEHHQYNGGNTTIAHPTSSNNNNNNSNQNQMHNVVSNTIAMRTQSNGAAAATHHHQQPISLAGTSIKGREFEDPATKAYLKAMAANALWQLCKGNLAICKSITESRALLCFAVLLEKGPEDVKYYSAMALMEICAVAEQHSELRRSAFKPTSPAAKAVVDQLLLKITEKADSDLLQPCIKAVGGLARTFRATETRFIEPLVKLLDEQEVEVTGEAVIALIKFACTDNYLHSNHAKAILDAGGVKHLSQLVYFGEQMIQVPALILLCYVGLHVPDSQVLAQDEVLNLLEWASKQSSLNADPQVEALLPESVNKLRVTRL